jgi:hypothetical protein
MSLPFSINKNDAMLVFMNRCKQVAIYSRVSHGIVAAFSLKNSVNGLMCPLLLWVTNNTLFVDRGAIPANYVDSINVNLNSDEGDIWLDDNEIIIGTGDMRDGKAYDVRFDLSMVGDYGFAIRHVNDNQINLFSHRMRSTKPITVELERCM